MQKLPPYINKTDKRGSFLGITRENWAEVNYIETAANEVRGNHYHKETRELFFIISGEIDIEVKNIRSGECLNFNVTQGDIFIIEPYELHTFRTTTPAKWINMLSQNLDLDNPDFHKLEKSS